MAVQREQVVQSAEKYVARGKIEAAIKEYRKLLAENPNDINTLNRVGDLYARINRIDQAVDFFTQIAEQYTAEGFFVKAIAIYKKIIKLDPTRLEVYEQLAELYHKQGLVTEARTQYQVLADYYQKHQNAASAIAIYQKMAQLEPDNPTYHVKLAEIYHQQQLIEKAMGEYRIIAELMIQHGRPQEAAQVYERALDLDSQNLSFISDAALKLREAGNAAGAAHFLTVAVERNPQAERVARMAHVEEAEEEPAPAPSEPEVEVELEAEPEGWPEELRLEKAPAEEEEDAFSLSFEDDELARVMAEASASVGAAPAAPAAEESGEIDLVLDEMFEVELPDEEEEPTSLVKPPADLLEAPRKPAWAQDTAPIAAPPAEVPIEALPEEEIELEIEALDLGDFDSAAFSLGETGQAAVAEPSATEPEPAPLRDETLSGWEVVAEPESAAEPEPAPPMEKPEPEPAPAPVEAAPATADDLVTEAEVLAKYGLEAKAVERLAEALRLRPNHLGAHALLIQIHLAKGRHSHVVELANRMSGVSARGANREPWQKVRKRLVDAGYRLDGEHVVSGPAPRPSAKEKKVDDLLRGLLDTPRTPTSRTPAVAPRPVTPAPPPPAAAAAAAEPVFAQPSPPAVPSAPPSGIFNPLQIGELVESLDWDEDGGGASAAADSSSNLFGGALPGPSIPPPPVPPPAPAAKSGALEDSGTSWLDEAERQGKDESLSASDLFDEEEDFFDLAGELVEELSKEEVFQRDGMLVQSEQTLEEIVEGFKKGVAEHLSPTDYDTHFNLGIAYREMGLLDEAIGEFQLASKDARYLVLCCSMLGLCFLDKGLPELAIKWYRRALEHPGIGEEDQLGMLYDLGNAYMLMGDNATAYKTFVDLYGINTNYRDVVAKLEELGRPH
ncbi:MAG TPA: tetratricopeptide repeat protein [Thermoanaerobaculia bacterium]